MKLKWENACVVHFLSPKWQMWIFALKYGNIVSTEIPKEKLNLLVFFFQSVMRYHQTCPPGGWIDTKCIRKMIQFSVLNWQEVDFENNSSWIPRMLPIQPKSESVRVSTVGTNNSLSNVLTNHSTILALLILSTSCISCFLYQI